MQFSHRWLSYQSKLSRGVSNVMCENGGCMAKASGRSLADLLCRASAVAQVQSDPFLSKLVNESIDDCAILPIQTHEILHTTDFGPLVGKDPFIAGEIAAMNALSDIYAMGGIPRYASVILQLAVDLTATEKEHILAGIFSACHAEGVNIVGGHTIDSTETIIGLSVIGEPRDKIILTKQGNQIGDMIVISKPIGTGLVLRGYYHGLLEEQMYNEAISTARSSNIVAMELLASSHTHAMTDITGFGLVGHLSEMLGCKKGARLYLSAVPYLRGIYQLSATAMTNDYITNNYDYAANSHRIKADMTDIRAVALFDPQTNGPMLLCIGKELLPTAQRLGFTCIGEVTEPTEIVIER